MNKAIFWDLQGTLGGEAVASIELFEPYPFAKDALKIAKDNGYRNIVITNQSRISKGILVLTGGGKESLGIFRDTWRGYKADIIADNAFEAVKRIIADAAHMHE